jgi:hypothetical protein
VFPSQKSATKHKKTKKPAARVSSSSMSDVSSLFAKKKKKKKSKKKDGKKLKSALASAADPGTAAAASDSSTPAGGSAASAAASGGWSGASSTQYKSMFGAGTAKLKTQLAPETSENDVKFEGMTEENYKNHVDQEKGKKEFHKARKLAELKAKKAADLKARPATAAVSAAAPAVKTSWRDRQKTRIAASSGNIRSQISNASHFPSLGGSTKKAAGAAGAWGSVDVDEDALREVEQTLHEQDPEVIKQRAAEAARQAKLDEIKRNTWQPSAADGGVDEALTDATITKSIKSMVREFLNIDDKKEAMLCIKELRNPTKHDFVCQRLFEEAFETLGGEDDLRKITGLIVSMRRNKPFLLTKEQLDETVAFLEECMDDIKVDIPKAPERFAFMIQQLKMKQVIADSKGKKFILSVKFDGAKEGYDYKMGAQGMGYYLQSGAGGGAAAAPAPSPAKATRPSIFGDAKPRTVSQPSAAAAAAKPAAKKVDPFGGARARPDPFGGATARTAKPAAAAATKPAAKKEPNPFGDAKPVRTDPFGGARPVKTRTDPFGGAKPVAEKKPNPFGDAKPVRTDPFGGARPVKTRTDPFGGAKPVEEKKPEAAPAAPAAQDKAALEQAYGKKKKKKKKKKAFVPDA